MTKTEYMDRLSHQLQYYEGNHQEILENYDGIVDELIDEGLSMEEIVSRLGKPSELAEEIAQEFQLNITEQTRKSTTLPQWAKYVLIGIGFLMVIPFIISLVLGAVGTLLAVVVGFVVFLFRGLFTSVSLWSLPSLSYNFKLLTSLTGLMGLVSISIMTYFLINWSIRLIKWFITKVKTLSQGGQ